ncbi:hypothetical protein SmJEL517_g03539 [Synchytrium microbalum]|uniref:glutamine--tRNA ligase n=1 Tax=Synchytrium microbalum TaxID=1806994 RepID=A0A507C1Q7_9FUNG|nr:uncharacterized protein SmJEL517_g03539 [Synchytrium microbalum]TPX33642.1 hypothetical protein SmJEL517_g03539 [Synchytrium microbalum]
MSDELVEKFKRIGFPEKQAKDTAGNKKIAPLLDTIITEVGGVDVVDKALGNLLYALAANISPKAMPHLSYLVAAIKDRRLLTNDQISAAIKFCESVNGTPDIAKFDTACGVGVVVTPDQIQDTVKALLASRRKELEKDRYTMLPKFLGDLRTSLRWAKPLEVKEELENQMLAALGPKDERDDPKKKKEDKKKEAVSAVKSPVEASSAAPASTNVFGRIAEMAKSYDFIHSGQLTQLHKAGENPQIKPELMVEHLKRTGGKVMTRFPPEPNGFLHIGHAKAINVNFCYAQAFNGNCYLRYDDTNPEAEEDKYFVAILDTIRWLGFEPWKITYASDHFQKLYDLAVDLIRRDKAYICHCTAEEMHSMRGGDSKGPRVECSHRSRPIAESIAEFEKMKQGRYAEGEATLRMKMDMSNPNPQFWDLVAYRVMYTSHVRTGDAWCIYPTYDYTHCLNDSFEDITHSLCTVEFRMSRESYYWLVDALELYKPVQWEYARLNLSYAITSKRRLNQLVTGGFVMGWDDPRLYTIAGVRRRGFTPEAINAFVRDGGVTTNLSMIPVERLENFVRDHLNDVAPRLMACLDPLKITISNLPADYLEMLTVKKNPRDESMGERTIPFTRTVYIDRSDFREVDDDPNFYRLAIGKTIGLLNVPCPITATSVVKDATTGQVTEVLVRYEPPETKKPKTYIQWIADSPKHNSPVRIEARILSHLFYHSDPSDNEAGWLNDINPDSLVIKTDAMVDIGILGCKNEDKFQFLRVGYFCVDPDSTPERIVVNRTVTLKEDAKKDGGVKSK